MTLEEYRKSCWPNYNPYHGDDKEARHLDYLNCCWGQESYASQRKQHLQRNQNNWLTGVPVGQLNLRAIFV